MKASLNWLKEFVEVAAEPRKLKADLTMIGLGVESFASVRDDVVLDIEVTTNRPDCLSHYGIARELATHYRKPLKPLRVAVKESGKPAAGEVSIEIADADLCARYCGRVVQNVHVKPSPPWLRDRLEAVGARSINNVADATNYVLMELGHPLHAFDLARLRKKKIIVRRAGRGERLRTLDGNDRTLRPEDLLIADSERPVALAGVMGGEETEISSATRSVLLESAWFEPVSVRRTAKLQGLHTEASHRFERGADIEMAPRALDRAAALIAELAGGEALSGIVDVYPQQRSRQGIRLRQSEILRILGADIPPVEVERTLTSLGFDVQQRSKEEWEAGPPSFRLDVSREVDLIEELARHYGYDRLPSRLRPAPPSLEPDVNREKELVVSASLVAMGYREIIPPSMVDPEENARFTDRPPVVIANPLSQEASVLRSSALPSMVRGLRWNLDRDQVDLRLFELGKTYTARPQGLPEERRVLTLGLSGHRRPASVHDTERPLDFFDLKGDLEALFDAFEVRDLRFEAAGCQCYETGLAGRFLGSSETLAICGLLSRTLTREQKLRQAVWLAEVDLERLLSFPLKQQAFKAFSKFPSVERDFSLVVPDGVTYGRLAEVIRGLAREEIRSFRPADLFRGGSIPAGHYSLLLRVNFYSLSHTLTSEEVEQVSQEVLRALSALGVRLRG